MSNKKLWIPLLLIGISTSIFGETKPATTKPTASKDVLDKSLFSKSIKPSDDFFDYINADWIKKNPIAPDKISWGMFDVLQEKSRTAIKKILTTAAATTAAKGSNKQILGDFYKSAMDTTYINKVGISAVDSWLKEIQNIKTNADFYTFISKSGLRDLTTPIGYYVDVDPKNTTRYILQIGQGGLGLPDRDFYFRTDEKSKKTLEEYKKYVTKLFELSKFDKSISASQQMENVLEVEKAIATVSSSRVELRDPEANYNLYTIEKLKTDFSGIDWNAFLKPMNIEPKEIVVGQVKFMHGLDSLRNAIPNDKWKSYLAFEFMNSTAKYLSEEFVDARFDFFGKVLSGAKVKEPRWKRVSGVAENYLRDIIGQEYVKTNFPPQAKARSLVLVNNIKASLADRIGALSWMGADTKAKALDKLQKIDVKIGYPDKWWTYENLDIKKQAYVLNYLNCAANENLRVLARLKKDKIDRTEWGMGPQTVNAYYNPTMNEIVFPAAILQPPFFYPNGDDAVNYGGIGMVIGHEITHGFDDQGSQFDGDGNLKNWWSEDDKKAYNGLTNKFVEQYNAFEIDSLHVNGELTQGENIADLGGMIISYNAFKKANPDNTKLINGLTPEQRFFVNYAIIWRDHMRPEALRNQILTNEHSPAKFRVNGVLGNLPQFHNAFNVKPGDNMFFPLEKRATMW